MKLPASVSLIIFLFFSFPEFTLSQNHDWADNANPAIGITHSMNANGSIIFAVTNIPINEVDNVDKNYRYFWSFGDGAYEDGIINFGSNTSVTVNGTVAAKSNVSATFTMTTSHLFVNASSFSNTKIYLELTPLYDDKDKPKRFNVSGVPPTISSTSTLPSSSNYLSIFTNRDAVLDDEITYVLNYGNSCPSNYGDLVFSYPAALTTEVGIVTFQNEPTPTIDPAAGTVTFNNITGITSFRNIFIRLRVNSTAGSASTINCSATLQLNGDSAACILNTTENDMAEIRRDKSHDPNYISSISGICLPAPSKLTYRVNFQNDGPVAAHFVAIKNIVPDYFDPATLVTLKPAGLLANYSPGTKTFTWILQGTHLKNGNPLRGINENGFNVTFPEEDTKDYIEFEIGFKPDRLADLKPCEVIVNQAEIIFDCNPSIMTNFFLTEFLCCNQKEKCRCIERRETLELLKSSGGAITPTLTGMNPYSTHQWYPSIGIADSEQSNSSLNPGVNTLYTLVSVNEAECARKITSVNVEVQPPPLCQPPFIVYEDVNYQDCRANILIKNCCNQNTTTTYSYLWNYQKGSSSYQATGCYLNLSGVTEASVTVTENGTSNSVVFYPNLKCPQFPFPWWNDWRFQTAGVLGLALLALVFILRRFRRFSG